MEERDFMIQEVSVVQLMVYHMAGNFNFRISESGTRGDCFRSWPCATVWIVRLCLRSILDYFSDSRQRHTR